MLNDVNLQHPGSTADRILEREILRLPAQDDTRRFAARLVRRRLCPITRDH
jgi:hypothetical protein